jgi:hypothetical protein
LNNNNDTTLYIHSKPTTVVFGMDMQYL